MSVLAAIGVLALLIVVHELGHFLAARLQNIHANRFSIGFGPTLLKYQGSETEYAIRAFPLGGYVGFPDDDPDSDIPRDDPNLLSNRPILDRAIVISAGVIANLIFAYFLLVGQAFTVGIPVFNAQGIPEFDYQPGVQITQVTAEDNSPAFQAGIEPGDVVLAIDGQEFGASRQAVTSFIEKVQTSPQETLEFQLLRGEEKLTVGVTPRLDEKNKGKIDIGLAPNGQALKDHPKNLAEGFSLGAKHYQKVVFLILGGFVQLVGNFGETAKQVAGPVAIVAMGANIASSNAGSLFEFAALISVNLAIINILPLPALDGGQLALLLVEALRGKPLPSRLQDGIMQTGFLLLMGLGVFLIVRDTVNLTNLQQLFQ
ncbi:MAG: RIP metalloprotease RseP [Spirulinaceae cyanobacterium]